MEVVGVVDSSADGWLSPVAFDAVTMKNTLGSPFVKPVLMM